jgi:hypothetical protein
VTGARYQHTQIGHFILVAIGLAMILIATLMAATGFNPIGLAVMILLALFASLFATLTVYMEGDAVKLYFGPGLIRKRFPLAEIESCQIVRNHWYYGWGLRRIPQGWLFNVSGFQAVEITMITGHKYRIGTDAPDGLMAVLQHAIQNTPKSQAYSARSPQHSHSS